jgi:hypothetical protein
VLLRDHEGMEVHGRHWPVQVANPVTDPPRGPTSCVSINTAVAVRVGDHRIAYQPAWHGQHRELEIFVDGERAGLPYEGLDLDDHWVTAFVMDNGATGLRVDYASQAVVTVTPHFWDAYGVWYMNVQASHTQADEGVMGAIPADSWLPLLPTRELVGPLPASLQERHEVLYRTFADAWRVTDETSLFVYEPGTSTKTATDRDWPAAKPPARCSPSSRCRGPIRQGPGCRSGRRRGYADESRTMTCTATACSIWPRPATNHSGPDYLLEQDLRRRATSVQVVANPPFVEQGSAVTLTATVLPIAGSDADGVTPTGSERFVVDSSPSDKPVRVDKQGRATVVRDRLDRGQHRVRSNTAGVGGGSTGHPRVERWSSPSGTTTSMAMFIISERGD